MDLVHVDKVSLQSTQAGFATLDDVVPGGADVVWSGPNAVANLGGNDDGLPSSLQRPAQVLLRTALVVRVSCIEVIHPQVDRFVDDGLRGRRIDLVAERITAQSDGRNPQP